MQGKHVTAQQKQGKAQPGTAQLSSTEQVGQGKTIQGKAGQGRSEQGTAKQGRAGRVGHSEAGQVGQATTGQRRAGRAGQNTARAGHLSIQLLQGRAKAKPTGQQHAGLCPGKDPRNGTQGLHSSTLLPPAGPKC